MRTTLEQISPDEYILAALTPEERLESAFSLAREVFKKKKLSMEDVEKAVKMVRRKANEK
jgi:GH35 family endo-1,4-beta-xylanase